MPRTASPKREHTIETYRAKRDFTVTAEPPPRYERPGNNAPMFVVQKHHAHRAGLHWDFRLEHNGVLWSWAVRKGPSLDPADKRIAVHVEDHPLDYADFRGTIPEGQYGAGEVETWDRGTWKPLADPENGMRDGEIKFTLAGQRLNGKFTLVRLRPRPNQRGRQDNWLLIKGHDEEERAGADAAAIETEIAPPVPANGASGGTATGDILNDPSNDPVAEPAASRATRRTSAARSSTRGKAARYAPGADSPPANGARRAALPQTQSPQLAAVSDEPPEGQDWLSEIKFDGYRLLIWLDNGTVRIVTRNGHDWTARLPAVAHAAHRIDAETALLDGELVALDKDGTSSFPALQAALSGGHDGTLHFFCFDLLHLNGWDLRPCALRERKRLLAALNVWDGMLRYSDHHQGDSGSMRRQACRMKLEGIICKQADAPYHEGRGHGWVKVKCQGREEFIVLGWTAPSGSRTGLGSLHLGYHDPAGNLHYAGGVGSGFSDDELGHLRARLDELAAPPPRRLVTAGEPLERTIHWVRPELVVETSFISWSGAGRVRQAVYLGLREDKSADEVVREPANAEAERREVTPREPAGDRSGGRRGPVIAVPPKQPPHHAQAAQLSGRIVTARAPKARGEVIEGIEITHPDRELWPGITKRDLADYWRAVADHALPGLAHRPLAIVRCPDGIGGEHFFQKRGGYALPAPIRDGQADKQPFLAVDDLSGLIGFVQISAIELHAWGATEAEPRRPDQVVFDLDPGEGVPFTRVVDAAHDVRMHIEGLGLLPFCRTTGGKGLHVVVPLAPEAEWDKVKPFCKALAELMSQEHPDRYLLTTKKADRKGRILIDWLRNGMGATAVASFCPRARPGATVATPIGWEEVDHDLDPAVFTLRTIPKWLSALKTDPWEGFDAARRPLPRLEVRAARPAAVGTDQAARPPRKRPPGKRPVIVTAAKPRRRG